MTSQNMQIRQKQASDLRTFPDLMYINHLYRSGPLLANLQCKPPYFLLKTEHDHAESFTHFYVCLYIRLFNWQNATCSNDYKT